MNLADSTIFRALSDLYLFAMMFSIGLELGRPSAKEEKRSFALIVRGVILGVLIGPLWSLFLIHVFRLPRELSLAMLCLSAAPGGPVLPAIVRIAKGHKAVAVEVTLFLAKISVFSAPFVAKELLAVHSLHFAEMPFLVRLVVIQMLPYLGARTLRRKYGDRLERWYGPSKFVALLCLVTILALMAFHGALRPTFFLDPKMWLVLLLFPAGLLAIGWTLGGPHVDNRIALSLGLNSHNLALAVVLATSAELATVERFGIVKVWFLLNFINLIVARILGHRGHAAPTGLGQAPMSR